LTNFQTYIIVRIRRKFLIRLSLKIPPHIKFVATLPLTCQCLQSKNWKQEDFCKNTFKSASWSSGSRWTH